jgi:heat shock protein HslJ
MSHPCFSARPGRIAVLTSLVGMCGASVASTPQDWAVLDARSADVCSRASGFLEPKIGAPIRFSDAIGIDVRVVTGIAPQPHMNGASATMLCAFDRRTGKAEVAEAPVEAMLTALPSAPSIEGIVWRAEDIGGGGIIDRSRATLTFGADGRISGSASCNGYSGSYALDRGALSFTSALVATQKACAPSLLDQERRFLAILGAARRIELLPTGALLLSTPEGTSLRFFPEQPVTPAVGSTMKHGRPLQCGSETLLVTFVGEIARIGFADGTEVELPAVAAADPASPRTYTNGRMTLEQRLEGPDAGLSFARGRMVPTPCLPVLEK